MTGSNKQIQILAIAPYRFLPAITGGQKGIALFYKYLSPLVSLYCVSVKDMPLEMKEGSYTVLPILSKSKLRYINPLYFFSLRKIIRENVRKCFVMLRRSVFYFACVISFKNEASGIPKR